MNDQNDNTIIFTISRMNPPTPGHLLLIKKLIEGNDFKTEICEYI